MSHMDQDSLIDSSHPSPQGTWVQDHSRPLELDIHIKPSFIKFFQFY